MKQGRKINKRGWAAAIAVALIAAIALTGTLAWRSISQQMINEVMEVTNDGGRIHDDFNGVENKDVYAENFTDKETGAPIFVRIKLLEYMETGDEAGVNRTVLDEDGRPVLNPDRLAKPLVEGMDINDTSTWHLHKPEETAEQDPFHKYWTWKMGGETVYMPTFNKNKDSLSVEVNGTYVGPNGTFDDVDPYEDYKTYTIGQDATAWAYYDADTNPDDEYLTDTRADKVPGGGGTEKTPSNPSGNYTKVEETHTAQKTQKTVSVLTMAEWEAKGGPIGNYWVWDTDGWAYWAEPLMPQTATGLFLDKLSINEHTSEKTYYAVDVVGEFATKGDWGTKNAADVKDQGFHANSFTEKAEALLNKVANARQGENQMWYIPMGNNIFQRINSDAGDLGDLVSAGPDTKIGTADDLNRRKVVYVEGGVTVGEKNYGVYFLEPDAAEPYYRAVGTDQNLGTADDDRIWTSEGGTFPESVVDQIADDLTVTAARDAVEMEKGTSLQLFAKLSLDGTELTENNEVVWKVTTSSGGRPAAGTLISSTGLLRVDASESAAELVITATSKLDSRLSKTYHIGLYGVASLTLDTLNNVTNVPAGGSVQLLAKLYHGGTLVTENPEDFTWSARTVTATRGVTETLAVDQITGVLTVGRSYAGQNVEATARYEDGGRILEASVQINVQDGEPISVVVKEVNEKSTVKVGEGNLRYQATLSGADQLNNSTVTWKVGKSTDGGKTITSIPGVGITTTGILSIDKDAYKANGGNDKLYIQATANDPTALDKDGNQAYGQKTLTVERPAKVKIESAETAKGTDGVTRTRPNRALVGDTFQLKATLLDSNNNPYPAGDLEWTLYSGVADKTNTKLTGATGATNSLKISNSEVAIGATPHKVTVKVKSKVDPDKSATYVINVASKYLDDGRTYDLISLTPCIAYDDWKEGNARVLMVRGSENTINSPHGYFSKSNDPSWKNSQIRKYCNGQASGTVVLDYYEAYGDAIWTNGKNADGTSGAKILTRKKLGNNLSDSDFEVTYDKMFILTEADVRGTINGVPTTDPRDFTTGVVMAGGLPDPFGLNWKRRHMDNDGTVSDAWYYLRTPHTDNMHKAGMSKTGVAEKVNGALSLQGQVYMGCWLKAESFYGG